MDKIYSQDFDAEKLKIQLQMLSDLVKTYRESQNLNRFIVTKVSTFVDILSKGPAARGLFSEIDKCVRVYLFIPVTIYIYCRKKVFCFVLG